MKVQILKALLANKIAFSIKPLKRGTGKNQKLSRLDFRRHMKELSEVVLVILGF